VRAFFYDTWGLVALANRGDPHHDVCVEADRQLERGGYAAATSDYVLDETVTLLHVAAGARVAIAFADLLLARIEIQDLSLLEVGPARRRRAFELFRKLAPDTPKLSFTDCTSFAVMTDAAIRFAFTVDRHFHRAGPGVRPLFSRDRTGVKFLEPA
jgi:uncharacterized protein